MWRVDSHVFVLDLQFVASSCRLAFLLVESLRPVEVFEFKFLLVFSRVCCFLLPPSVLQV